MGRCPQSWVWPKFETTDGGALRSHVEHAHPFGTSFCGTERIPGPCGAGRRDYFAFAGDLVGLHSIFDLRTDLAMSVAGEGFLKIHFKLSGNNTVRFSGRDEINVPARSMGIAIHPCGVAKLDAHAKGASENSLTLACRPALFTEELQLDLGLLPQPIRNFASGKDPELYWRLLPLSSRIRKTVEDMLTCPYGGRFTHIHARARALDLICMMLDVLTNDELPATMRLAPRDVVTLEGLRRFLGDCCMNPPTIAQLSRQAGMNRTKLTRGFHYLFNETIFDYCHRMRMTRARELLLHGLPIGTVALDVGYHHHSSFAQAFRAYYGFPPLELRRRTASSRLTRLK